ncbi:MAG: hypothetical protein QOD57_4387, partial [Actinomycetota bacterium]|nr:hypothetical protein [Actinomycetota bacterium]
GERYDDQAVLDGTTWALHLEHDGRSVSTSGSNATPPGWTQVQGALEQLTGKPCR